ncbi:MAG: glycerol kinase GlpK [Candidatus Nanopelagicaceae bacterium]
MIYIGALDQGTTSTRFIIFNELGEIISQHQMEHQQILPQSGWVEHDAMEIWQNTLKVIEGALTKAGIKEQELSAIGITNQRETTVCWDRETGIPISNAIVWQDTRTAEYLNQFPEQVKSTITLKTGTPIAPYFSASKMAWILQNKVSNTANIAFGTIDSWLLFKLTGVFATDVSNASRTQLMNLESLDWDDELLSIFGIKRQWLPEIKSSSEVYGMTGSGVPIAGILGDQQAAMVGQTCFEKGESKTTYGTGNFALTSTGDKLVRSKHGLITTVLFKFGAAPVQYALEGSVAVTGSAVQWLRDQLGFINSATEVETLAASVPDNGGVYFVPAFSGLFAPYWRSDARGVIVGLTRANTKAHIARATLEAICYQTKEVIDAMEADSGIKLTEMRVDGGITNNKLCMQLQSDIMAIDIVKPVITETTALGAAFAAGLAVGVWESTSQIKKIWKREATWNSKSDANWRSVGYQKWRDAITRTYDLA